MRVQPDVVWGHPGQVLAGYSAHVDLLVIGYHRRAEVVVDQGGGLDRNHEVVDSPRHIGWRTLS